MVFGCNGIANVMEEGAAHVFLTLIGAQRARGRLQAVFESIDLEAELRPLLPLEDQQNLIRKGALLGIMCPMVAHDQVPFFLGALFEAREVYGSKAVHEGGLLLASTLPVLFVRTGLPWHCSAITSNPPAWDCHRNPAVSDLRCYAHIGGQN